MNQYRRIVSYLYKYSNGKKGENTGYVRVDTKEEGIRLHFHIKDLRMMDERRLRAHFYIHEEDGLRLIFVDEFLCSRGNCEYKNLVMTDFEDASLDNVNGIVILDQNGLLYGSCWDDREINGEMLMRNKESEPQEGDNQSEQQEELKEQELREIAGIELQISETPEAEESRTWISDFPQINLEGAENLVQAVRIELKDIAKLSPKDWKLADNAFLKQAYEMEGHLLLGKIRMQDDSQIWILGVPGIYDNREKYLAGIFGFDDYIPVEKGEFKTGGKGYWIRQVQEME